MSAEGSRFDPIQTDENVTFETPIVLDKDIDVRASTIVMRQPYLIYYASYFDSSILRQAYSCIVDVLTIAVFFIAAYATSIIVFYGKSHIPKGRISSDIEAQHLRCSKHFDSSFPFYAVVSEHIEENIS